MIQIADFCRQFDIIPKGIQIVTVSENQEYSSSVLGFGTPSGPHALRSQ
jgi:hypothetical protein